MKRRAGPIVIAIAFVAMLVWTWGGWPDPIVDFGRELYVPWQLSLGKVLYRDVAHFNGPISQYFNALLFRVLGVSLRTLVLANTAIAAAMVLMIWQLFRAAGGRLSATVACLSFITLFMSIQLVTIGNYNWITPYSHELTHGVALSFAAMCVLMRFIVRPRSSTSFVIGLLIGLVFLTKPEVFIAAAPAVWIGMVLAMRIHRTRVGLVSFFVGACFPVIASMLLFSMRGTLGGWNYLFDSRLSGLNFYRISMGTDDPARNAARAMLQLGAYLLALAPAFLLDLRRVRWFVGVAYAITLAVTLRLLESKLSWQEAFRGIMPAVLLASIFLWRSRWTARGVVRLTLASFATLLLLKIVLATRLYHYGFALTMPAFLVLTAMGTSWLARGCTLRFATITALAVIVHVHLKVYGYRYHDKPAIVAPGTADEFRADQFGQLVNEVVGVISGTPKDATLAVIPQGAMINYLSGRENPTPYITLMPPEVLMFGDQAIRDAYAHHPPDLLVVIESDFHEYGFETFADFAPKTAAWMRENYAAMPSALPDQARLFVLHRHGN